MVREIGEMMRNSTISEAFYTQENESLVCDLLRGGIGDSSRGYLCLLAVGEERIQPIGGPDALQVCHRLHVRQKIVRDDIKRAQVNENRARRLYLEIDP